jgi:hypothetical protein
LTFAPIVLPTAPWKRYPAISQSSMSPRLSMANRHQRRYEARKRKKKGDRGRKKRRR